MTVTPLHKEIDSLLGKLCDACGYQGESGTEAFFEVLYEAVTKVHDDWDDTVGQSHRDGLCFNVNALLSDAIIDVLSENAASGTA